MEKQVIEKLIDTAIKQLKFSYAPYSNFKVGAALLAKNGTVYTGCNIENAAFTPTNCADVGRGNRGSSHFSSQSVRACTNLMQSVLLVERKEF